MTKRQPVVARVPGPFTAITVAALSRIMDNIVPLILGFVLVIVVCRFDQTAAGPWELAKDIVVGFLAFMTGAATSKRSPPPSS